MKRATAEIRSIRLKWLIVVDSRGGTVEPEMVQAGVAQSPHFQWPSQITRHRASRVDRESKFPTPA